MIFFFDLDGTLLNSNKEISSDDLAALRRFKEKGNTLAVTTGRSVKGTLNLLNKYDLLKKGDYLITFQGSIIMEADTKKVIKSDCIPFLDVKELLNSIWDFGLYAHTFDLERIYVPLVNENFMRYNDITHEEYEIFKDKKELNEIKESLIPKVISVSYENKEKLAEFKEFYKEREKGRFNSFFSQPMFLEYCKEGVNKGSALKSLSDYLGADLKDTIAAGDERNDIPMIEAAGYGFAMKNSHDDLKERADFVLDHTNDESGVSHILYKFM